MMNDVGEALAAFVAMPETKPIAQPKELSTTNINWKGGSITSQKRLTTKYFISVIAQATSFRS